MTDPRAAAFDELLAVMQGEQAYRRELEAATDPGPDPLPGLYRFGYYQQGPSTSNPVETVYGRQEERWGVTFDTILAFTPMDTWADIACPSWWTTTYGAARSRWAADYGTVVSLALCPKTTTGGITAVDPADVWACFTDAARNLLAAGMGECIVRIGWEHNGTWYPWSSVEHPGTYKARFRDAVAAMRGVHDGFLFDWNLAGTKPIKLEAFDPDSVDVVSIDLYDNPQDWPTLRAALDASWELAQDAGKLWGVAEWGLWGKDNPGFIRNMGAYLDAHPHVHQAYFDANSSADHRLASFPPSETAYAEWAEQATTV